MLVISDLNQALKPTAIALGNFDGVHRGHQCVIRPVLSHAPELVPTVVTFNPHPHEFFSGMPRLLLTPMPEKIAQLEAVGIEQLVLLPFNAQLAKLNAREFIQQILIQQLQARWVSVGFDFHFACNRCGSVADLQLAWGNRLNIVQKQMMEGSSVRISSSAIRTALAQGEIELANSLLGRPYTLVGMVIEGQQLGRKLGFPTANLQLPLQKFLPKDGVYAVRVAEQLAVMNIGVRPTVAGESKRTIEVHLLNWSGDLYGRELAIQMVKFLRPEKKFASLEQLKEQIEADCEAARNISLKTSNAQSSVAI